MFFVHADEPTAEALGAINNEPPSATTTAAAPVKNVFRALVRRIEISVARVVLQSLIRNAQPTTLAWARVDQAPWTLTEMCDGHDESLVPDSADQGILAVGQIRDDTDQGGATCWPNSHSRADPRTPGR
ncbi:hypothetical protein [Streptomyces kanasensis]|nr:hypothetical protein [Streptomyces kanasensis]